MSSTSGTRSLLPTFTQALTSAWRGDKGWAQVLVVVLRPVSWLYAGLMAVRRGLYQRGFYKTIRLPVPVIVVGNVMVGGVGKTPVTMALVHHLKAQGWHVGVLSRGYGRKTSNTHAVSPTSHSHAVGDEPMLIARNCRVPVFVSASRVDAGRALLAIHPDVQVLVCDDGLQHWSLARDLELCVFDERGLGNGHLLPAGPLRESWPRKVLNPHVPCWVLNTQATAQAHEFAVDRRLADYAVQADGTRMPLSHWHHTPVQALAGIAKPDVFFAMLRDKGLMLSQTYALPDHAELETFDIDPKQGDVFCTEKDAIKLWVNHPQAWAIPLQTTLPEALLTAIDSHLTAAQRAKLSSPHGHQTV